MSLARRIVTVTLAAALSLPLLGGGSRARAQSAPPAAAGAADHTALIAERARVRAQLDRLSAEIDALKRAGAASSLGVRNDYRLRARLADAEALARRLTEIDARLGAPAKPATAETGITVAPPPTVSVTDGPAEMEAKADILADQARRVAGEAEALSRRAGQLRARRDLRRRAGQMEHDPFSPLEGAKTRSLTVGPSLGPTSGFSAGPEKQSGGGATNNAVSPPPADRAGAGGVSVTGTNTPTAAPGAVSGSHALVSPGTPPSPTAGATGTDTPALSAQLRDLLDPVTLAEIRRLEASAAPGAAIEAMERAAAGLRARADRLSGQSQALRVRAHAR